MRLASSSSAPLVSEEFLRDPEAGPLQGTELAEGLPIQVSLHGFHSTVSACIAQFEKDPPEGDGTLAVEIHKALALPRMLGMDPGVWHYLACVARPDYVWYRWGSGGFVSRERFLGSIKRNAFARLWWCAEVMSQEQDYTGVSACFEQQDLYEAVFGRAFSKFPLAARVFVEGLSNLERRVVREVAKDFNLMLSTFVLEDMAEDQIRDLIGERIAFRSAEIGH
jgi:hypothetical protein